MRMICGNCDGRSESCVVENIKGIAVRLYMCTQRDSDNWGQKVQEDDTCLDWEPERMEAEK